MDGHLSVCRQDGGATTAIWPDWSATEMRSVDYTDRNWPDPQLAEVGQAARTKVARLSAEVSPEKRHRCRKRVLRRHFG